MSLPELCSTLFFDKSQISKQLLKPNEVSSTSHRIQIVTNTQYGNFALWVYTFFLRNSVQFPFNSSFNVSERILMTCSCLIKRTRVEDSFVTSLTSLPLSRRVSKCTRYQLCLHRLPIISLLGIYNVAKLNEIKMMDRDRTFNLQPNLKVPGHVARKPEL